MRHGSAWKLRGRDLERLVPKSVKEDAAQVAFAERRQNHDNQFTRIFRTARYAQCRDHRRSRRDADQQTFFERKTPRHLDGLIVANGDDLVNEILAQNARNEASADSLNLVWGGLATGKHWTFGRFHGHRLERWLLRLDVFRNAGDGSTRADTGDEKIHAPVRVRPNLRTGGLEVNFRIGRVIKLLEHVAIGS